MPKYGKIGVGSCALVLGRKVKRHRDSACGLISIFIPKTDIAARAAVWQVMKRDQPVGLAAAVSLQTNDYCKINFVPLLATSRLSSTCDGKVN